MNSSHQELWARLEAYSFDEPGAALPFRSRLAQENCWNLAFAARAIEEYRRFAFLAVTAGHPVAPSDPVDQVWHLHLLYTRAYWDDFCPRVLGQALHHGPTRGGDEEERKFHDWYGKTLTSYRHFFNEEPPADFWPDAATRFAPETKFARVNTSQHWVVPKPPGVRTLARRLRAALVIALALSAAQGAYGAEDSAPVWNPLDFRGPEFLRLYLILMAAAWGIAVLWRHLRWRALSRQAEEGATQPAEPEPTLSVSEIAYLAGGANRAVQSAVVTLHSRGLVTVEADGSLLPCKTAAPVSPELPPFERAILEAAGTRHRVREIQGSSVFALPLQVMRRSLESLGLIIAREALDAAVWGPRFALGAPLILGIAKIGVGISRGKPVGLLLILCGINVLLCARFKFSTETTARGKRLLDRWRSRHTPQPYSAARVSRSDYDGVPTSALMVALFGASALTGDGEGGLLRKALFPPSHGSGGSSGCGGSGGCGGGGGGGGGCGGCGGH